MKELLFILIVISQISCNSREYPISHDNSYRFMQVTIDGKTTDDIEITSYFYEPRNGFLDVQAYHGGEFIGLHCDGLSGVGVYVLDDTKIGAYVIVPGNGGQTDQNHKGILEITEIEQEQNHGAASPYRDVTITGLFAFEVVGTNGVKHSLKNGIFRIKVFDVLYY